MERILLVEDDAEIVSALMEFLRAEGFLVENAAGQKEALQKIRERDYDLLLVDISLADGNGYAVCAAARAEKEDIAVIFLTASADEYSTVAGLDMGADDYVTKPFTPLELLARVNSHLRRYSKYLSAVNNEQLNDHIYTIGGLELNEDTVEVTVDGEPVRLTPMEFKIVQLLIKNPGRVFSADEIYERIWNEKAVNTDTIMVHVRNIREKIELDPKNPKYLKVVWGVGYKIDKQ